MAEILKGKPVADKINEGIVNDIEALKEKGVIPTLCIVRVGDNESDMAYERGAVKKCELLGVRCVTHHMPADVTEEALLGLIDDINMDRGIHLSLIHI